jgi:hypothetical protein
LNSEIKKFVTDEDGNLQDFLNGANKKAVEGYVTALNTVLSGGGAEALNKF